MIEVFQAEWSPHSEKVRMKLTELGVDFVARQVPAEGEDRSELEERFTPWSEARPHRRKDDEH